MSPRERILAAIEHRPVDRVPLDYWGTPEVTDALKTAVGVTESRELWPALGVDKIVNVMPPYLGPVFPVEGGLRRDFFGVLRKPVAHQHGVYYEICRHPLADFQSIDDIRRNYRWPSAEEIDLSDVVALCDENAGYAIQAGYLAPFYIYLNLRGLERTFLDLALEPELADYIVERICDFLFPFHRRLFAIGQGRIDIAQVTDDYGGQNGLLISPEMFRRYFESSFRASVQLVSSYGIRVFHHDDGAIGELLPDLVDLGIDVLNPIQWRLSGMSREGLKRDYGHRVCFHGAIDNQYVLPFGSADEIRQEVISCIDTLAADGTGFILAPCHNIQPNTSVESILLMYETARKYGAR